MIECRCSTCKIYSEVMASEEPSCCSWYMDNVICGDKTPDDCPDYEKKFKHNLEENNWLP